MQRLSARGFTLVELVAVIIILGVVGTAVVSFIGFSAQVFVDVNGRDKVLADSRFVVERLNRELRDAVPNSLRVTRTNNAHCIEFMPIAWSSFYIDLPIAPEPASSSFTAVQLGLGGQFDAFNPETVNYLIVYPVSQANVYGQNSQNRVLLANPGSPANGLVQINLQQSRQFPLDAASPASRFYIGSEPVSYCVLSNGQMRRFTNYGISAVQLTSFGNNPGVLMGENIQNTISNTLETALDNPFRVTQSELTRNAYVHILLRFAREDQPAEVVVFNNEVHVANVP